MLLFFMFVPPQGQPGGRVGAAGSSIKEYNGVLYGKYADQVQQVVASDKDFAEFKQPRFAAIFNVFFVFWVKHKATRVLRNNSIVECLRARSSGHLLHKLPELVELDRVGHPVTFPYVLLTSFPASNSKTQYM